MTYYFGSGPEFDSLEEAQEDWFKDHDALPTTYYWRIYEDDAVVAEGNTALEPPYGTIVYWDDR